MISFIALILWMISPFFLVPALIIVIVLYRGRQKENEMLRQKLRHFYNNGQIPPEELERVEQELPPRPAPKPAQTQTAAPVRPYVRTLRQPGSASPENTLRSYSAIHVVLILGVLFILIAGLIFATTAWAYLSTLMRLVILCSSSLLFFIASAAAERKLQLPQTGAAFYILGSVFLPVIIVAIGYFELLGPWLSLYGEGRYTLGLMAFILLCAASILGSKKYDSQGFAWAAWICVLCAGYCAVRTLTDSFDAILFLFTIFSFTLCILKERIAAVLTAPFPLICADLTPVSLWLSRSLNLLLFLRVLYQCGMFFTGSFFLLAASMMLLCTAIYQKRNNQDSWTPVLIPLLVFSCGMGLAFLLPAETYLRLTFTACLVFLCFCLLNYVHWFRDLIPGFSSRLTSDLVSAGVCFWCGIQIASGAFYQYYRIPLTDLSMYLGSFCALTLFFLLILLQAFRKEPLSDTKGAVWLLPHALLPALIPLSNIIEIWRNAPTDQSLFLLYYVLLTIFSCWSLLRSKRNTAPKLLHSLSLAMLIYGPAAVVWLKTFHPECAASPYLILLTIYLCLLLIRRLQSFSQSDEDAGSPRHLSLILYAAGTCALAGVFTAAGDLFPSISPPWLLTAPAAVVLLFIAFDRFGLGKLSKHYHAAAKPMRMFTLAASTLLAGICLITFLLNPTLRASYLLIGFILTLVSFFHTYFETGNLSACFPLLFVYPAAVSLVHRLFPGVNESLSLIVQLILLLILALSGRLMFPRFYTLSASGKDDVHKDDGAPAPSHPVSKIQGRIDWLSLINLVVPPALLGAESPGWRFTGAILFAFYFAFFIGRFSQGTACQSEQMNVSKTPQRFFTNADRVVLTLSLCSLCFAYWIQPFFHCPEILAVELGLLPLPAAAFILWKWIWTDHSKGMSAFLYGISIYCMLRLALDAVSYGFLIDTLILSISALILLLLSFQLKKKRWFFLSTAVLAGMALYMSREFWLSIAWWIYLLTAGLLLIAAAALNETYKRRGSSISQKLGRFLGDWNW